MAMKFLAIFLVFSSAIFSDYEVSVFLGKTPEARYQGDMEYPFGVEFDSLDNMYIVEYNGNCLDVLDRQGVFKKLGGTKKIGSAEKSCHVSKALFNRMHNLLIDKNDIVFMSDTFNHVLRRYDAESGMLNIEVGGDKGFQDGLKLEAKFDEFYCAVFNPDKSKIVIADLKNRRVRSLDVASGVVSTIAGTGEKGVPKDGALAVESPLIDPRAVAVDANDQIYIADRGGNALRMIDRSGKIVTLVNKSGKKGLALGPALDAQLNGPKYVATDAEGNVYIADDENHRICVYNPKTKQLSALIGATSPLKGWELKRPHGVTVHPDGSIYVVDSGHDRILKLVKK